MDHVFLPRSHSLPFRWMILRHFGVRTPHLRGDVAEIRRFVAPTPPPRSPVSKSPISFQAARQQVFESPSSEFMVPGKVTLQDLQHVFRFLFAFLRLFSDFMDLWTLHKQYREPARFWVTFQNYCTHRILSAFRIYGPGTLPLRCMILGAFQIWWPTPPFYSRF